MAPYCDLGYAIQLQKCLDGFKIKSRNSTTYRAMNCSVTFVKTPLVGVRRTAWKNALREMEWFLSGSDNINTLHPKVHHWWKPWARNDGRIRNNYGTQFRRFAGRFQDVDQIKYAIETLKNKPFSRRNVISTWNTADMIHPTTPITNCHGTVIQFFVDPNDNVHMTMYQRSCDMVLGVPHNWIQYWAFLMYMADLADLNVGSMTWIGGDCHVYEDHKEVAEKIIKAAMVDNDKYNWTSPNLICNPSSDEFKADDYSLSDEYKPVMELKAKMVV